MVYEKDREDFGYVRWLLVGNKVMGGIRVIVLKITSIKFSIELISVPS